MLPDIFRSKVLICYIFNLSTFILAFFFSFSYPSYLKYGHSWSLWGALSGSVHGCWPRSPHDQARVAHWGRASCAVWVPSLSEIPAVQTLAFWIIRGFQNHSGLKNNWTKARNHYLGSETAEMETAEKSTGCEGSLDAGCCTDWLSVFSKDLWNLRSIQGWGEAEATEKRKAEGKKGRECVRKSSSGGERTSGRDSKEWALWGDELRTPEN